jgi:hypothetical protein
MIHADESPGTGFIIQQANTSILTNEFRDIPECGAGSETAFSNSFAHDLAIG